MLIEQREARVRGTKLDEQACREERRQQDPPQDYALPDAGIMGRAARRPLARDQGKREYQRHGSGEAEPGGDARVRRIVGDPDREYRDQLDEQQNDTQERDNDEPVQQQVTQANRDGGPEVAIIPLLNWLVI